MLNGWVKIDPISGIINWDTFTETNPFDSTYSPMSRISCCDPDCGIETFQSQKDYSFPSGGDTVVDFYFDTKPTKYIILKNGTSLYETPWGGLTSYQQQLNEYLTENGLPSATVSPDNLPTTYNLSVDAGDVITVQILSLDKYASYLVECIETGTDCVMSDWSPWTPWTNNGDGTETRMRQRTIISQPTGDGAACGDTIESETRKRQTRDCIVSAWSAWSSWVDNGNGTESRTRTRTIITPAGENGNPCPPLAETETRTIQAPCEYAEWTVWSTWVDQGNGTECRTRTRKVISGTNCPDTTQQECRTMGAIPANFTFIADSASQQWTITEPYIGDENVNITTLNSFHITSSSPKQFTGSVDPTSVHISFNHTITAGKDGLLSKIRITDLDTNEIITTDESVDTSNYAKILYFANKPQLNLEFRFYN